MFLVKGEKMESEYNDFGVGLQEVLFECEKLGGQAVQVIDEFSGTIAQPRKQ